ncbi:signal transduction histidine kinase LytS [Planococcus antarcticus DSM 14505]|uniref:histidine kinase n=1 Tax=Planococcus antarcticus DSM 14505 TaxID=1185653 RepID=A0AA87IP31_9BACL|nr:ATP-binding protein [Planococcus antarcticus]EIM08059.1 signal transduction histidine kinase LytS [Planococcus antarcticus DSM 14505]
MNLFTEAKTIVKTNIRDYGMYIALIVIMLTFTIMTDGLFISSRNISNLLDSAGYIAVLAVGMTLVIVLRQYMEIQKARFSDRLQFFTELDSTCLNLQIPGLTLQPLIENAVIHAIEPEEDGGHIWFRIKDQQGEVWIEIEDNGKGMSQEKRQRLLEGSILPAEGHSTGIGFANVVKRLQLFYGKDDLMDIESEIGQGTKIILKLPKVRGAANHDQTVDSR